MSLNLPKHKNNLDSEEQRFRFIYGDASSTYNSALLIAEAEEATAEHMNWMREGNKAQMKGRRKPKSK